MEFNTATLDAAFKGFKTIYNDSFEVTESRSDAIAMEVNSNSSEEEYGWLGMFPDLRKWVGDRTIKKLSRHGFTIRNEKFESTIAVMREDFEDDKLGLFRPMFAEAGRLAKAHKDQLVFGVLKGGFDTKCFDGQNFFDTDHPVTIDQAETSFSNLQDGDGPGWYLLDTTREVRPIIFQKRTGYEFNAVDGPNEGHTFLQDEHLYGVRARVNAGLGLWQLAHGSKQPLTVENYELARSAMMEAKSTDGQYLGVSPNILVVPPQLESAARRILKADQIEGTSNIWKDSADVIVSFDVA